MLFADLLSLHLVTFLMFFILVIHVHVGGSANMKVSALQMQDNAKCLPSPT